VADMMFLELICEGFDFLKFDLMFFELVCVGFDFLEFC
jgi:hypothetical protein